MFSPLGQVIVVVMVSQCPPLEYVYQNSKKYCNHRHFWWIGWIEYYLTIG